MGTLRRSDGVAERAAARDVGTVGDDDDRPARPVILRQPVGGEHDRVVERRSGLGIDGEVGDLVASLRGSRRDPGQRDGRAAEHDDADVVVRPGARGELLHGGNRVVERTPTHRLRAVDRNHDALGLTQVDRLGAPDRPAVLGQMRRRRADGRHVRDAQRRERARVDSLDPRSGSRDRRGEECREQGNADERPLHSKPPPKPVAANDARTWSESSAAKNEGGRTTLLAASFSRK